MGWNAKAGSTTTAKDKTLKTKKTTVVKPKAAVKSPAKKTPVKAPAKKTETKATAKKTEKPSTKSTAKVEKPAQKSATKTSAKNLAIHQRIIQHSLEMANLKPNQCRWPIGDPDSENFHFCGKTVFTGKPYCYEHCRLAYQFTPPKKKQ